MTHESFNVGRFTNKVGHLVLIAAILFICCQFLSVHREFVVGFKNRRLNEDQTLLQTKERELHRLKMRLNVLDKKKAVNSPQIYFVTPTYARPTQKADLTRLSHTLMHIPNLYWIVIEDNNTTSLMVSELLKRVHLFALTPPEHKLGQSARGVVQRNTALRWIRTTLSSQADCVVYFGDDENTYDLRLSKKCDIFEEWVWPVGLVSGLMVERPLVNHSNKVYGWLTGWESERPFPIDTYGRFCNQFEFDTDT